MCIIFYLFKIPNKEICLMICFCSLSGGKCSFLTLHFNGETMIEQIDVHYFSFCPSMLLLIVATLASYSIFLLLSMCIYTGK